MGNPIDPAVFHGIFHIGRQQKKRVLNTTPQVMAMIADFWSWVLWGHKKYTLKFSSRSIIPTIANLGSFGFSDILIHQEKSENPDFLWYLMSCFLVRQHILIFGKIDRLLSQQKRTQIWGSNPVTSPVELMLPDFLPQIISNYHQIN